jgi:hypothetical protein
VAPYSKQADTRVQFPPPRCTGRGGGESTHVSTYLRAVGRCGRSAHNRCWGGTKNKLSVRTHIARYHSCVHFIIPPKEECGYCSQQKKSGVQRVMSDPLSVQLYSICWTKEAGVQWISAQPDPMQNHVEKRCAPPPPKPLTPPITQAPTDSVY